jgi:hypothetical protein
VAGIALICFVVWLALLDNSEDLQATTPTTQQPLPTNSVVSDIYREQCQRVLHHARIGAGFFADKSGWAACWKGGEYVRPLGKVRVLKGAKAGNYTIDPPGVPTDCYWDGHRAFDAVQVDSHDGRRNFTGLSAVMLQYFQDIADNRQFYHCFGQFLQ